MSAGAGSGTLDGMCGRYATSRSPEDLAEDFDVEFITGPGPGLDPTAPPGRSGEEGAGAPAVDYNVAPTKSAPVVLVRAPRAPADGPEPEQAVRWLRLLTWGLVPSWAKDRSVGQRMINARAETLLDKTFRRAALGRRCLVPADGWYEWQASPTERDARGRPRKQPFFMAPVIGGSIAFAGVYEFWRDRAAHPDDDDPWLATFSIITTEAEPGLQAVHDRMPLVLPAERWDDWLDPEVQDEDAVRALLVPPVAGRFSAIPVSTRVNSVANNGPELLDELGPDQLRGVLDPNTGELIGGGDVALF